MPVILPKQEVEEGGLKLEASLGIMFEKLHFNQ
jgi:hypothetical protein